MQKYRVVVLGATDCAYFKMISTDWLTNGKYLSKRCGKYDEESDGENNYSYDCKYIDKIAC